jgi:DNA repair protein RadC
LVRILIESGDTRSRKNVVDLSRGLLNKFGTVENIDQASITEIYQIQGIGAAKAAQINTALEVLKRISSKPS